MSNVIGAKYGRSTLRDVLIPRIGKDFRIVFGAKSSCTDGRNIYVADVPDSADENNRREAEVTSYHEAEHIRAFREESQKRNSPFRGISTVAQANQVICKGIDPKHHKLVATLFNVYEDIRIDHAVNNRYPGTVEKYRASYSHMLGQHAEMWGEIPAIRKLLLTVIAKAHSRFYARNCYDPLDLAKMSDPETEALYSDLIAKREKAIDKMQDMQDA